MGAGVSAAAEAMLSGREETACSGAWHPAKHSSTSSAATGPNRKSLIVNTSFPKEKSRVAPCFFRSIYIYTTLVFPMLVSISTVAGS